VSASPEDFQNPSKEAQIPKSYTKKYHASKKKRSNERILEDLHMEVMESEKEKLNLEKEKPKLEIEIEPTTTEASKMRG